MKIKRIFITGGAGFIGSHVADYFLNKGFFVTVYDNLSKGKKEFLKGCIGKARFQFINGDLLNVVSLGRSLAGDDDLVIHLAANPDVSKGAYDPSIDFSQTTLATFNLLQEMKMKNIKRLLYTSGSGVYGDCGVRSISESYGPLQPTSLYGATKLSAEAMISAFSSLYDIQSWILRPANIIGGRATHGVVFDFINKLRKTPKKLMVLGNGKQSKSYVYIDDFVEAMMIILEKSNDKMNIFNVSSKTFVTVDEIANLVLEGMGLHDVAISYTGGRYGWAGDVPIIRLNSSKLRNLGWKEKFPSSGAVKKTIDVILSENYE